MLFIDYSSAFKAVTPTLGLHPPTPWLLDFLTGRLQSVALAPHRGVPTAHPLHAVYTWLCCLRQGQLQMTTRWCDEPRAESPLYRRKVAWCEDNNLILNMEKERTVDMKKERGTQQLLFTQELKVDRVDLRDSSHPQHGLFSLLLLIQDSRTPSSHLPLDIWTTVCEHTGLIYLLPKWTNLLIV